MLLNRGMKAFLIYNTMKIKINNTEYTIKNTIRSMFIWEQITGRLFELKNTMDFYIYYYSILMASNPECDLTFDDFINICDNDQTVLVELQNCLNKLTAIQNQLKTEGDSSEKK